MRRIIVAATSIAVVASAALLLLTDTQIRRSRTALARGDVAGAVEAAAGARDLAPWAASPRLQLALVLEEAGSLHAARRSIAAALERSPRDWQLWLVAARVQTKLGDISAARASAARAVALNRQSPLFDQIPEDGPKRR